MRLALAGQKRSSRGPTNDAKSDGFNTGSEACGGRAKIELSAGPPMMQKVEGFSTETEACGGRAKVDGREATNDAESGRF